MPWWNMQQYNQFFNRGIGPERFFLPFIIPAFVWSLIWKGLALYKAARNGQKGWFVVLLVVNTMGILEIVYLLFFSNLKPIKKKNK